MMRSENFFNLENLPEHVEAPVLIVSTIVGRGMFSLGEAVKERFPDTAPVYHVAIEDFLPRNAVTEDLQRYKFISNKLPILLYLIYKVPIFYYRKYLREKRFSKSDLQLLKERIEWLDARTVICVSHRPAFWVSNLKRKERMNFKIWGILGEYGNTLGWKYIFWNEVDGFLSPLDQGELDYSFPTHLQFRKITLPARRIFYEAAQRPGERNSVLVVCGFWGQGPILEILQKLLSANSPLRIYVVCGENASLLDKIRRTFKNHPNIEAYGAVESLAPLLKACACVITKPGISTILEAQAAQRKIFLLKGMPVAEDNNARYAIKHFGAEWFSPERFRQWLAVQAGNPQAARSSKL